MPFVVPNLSTFSVSSDLAAGATRNVTPIQAGATSRIGSSIYASAPGGLETLFTAWGFLAGKAPPGAQSLVVAAGGTTFLRGSCFAYGGYARAYGDIFVLVEEFETLEPVHSGLGDTHDPGIAEIAPDPMAPLGTLVFDRRVHSASTIIINQETSVFGYQITSPIDAEPDATVLVMPITPGKVYRWWIASYQYCEVAVAGFAGSNMAFDFGPVFFAFN